MVTTNPVGWADVNRESADILKALSKDKALIVKDLTTELQEFIKHGDIEEFSAFLRAFKDSYIVLDDKTDGEQTN